MHFVNTVDTGKKRFDANLLLCQINGRGNSSYSLVFHSEEEARCAVTTSGFFFAHSSISATLSKMALQDRY